MSTFVLLTITGLGLGAMYFLVASGLSLIYGLMGVLNFAHGVFITVRRTRCGSPSRSSAACPVSGCSSRPPGPRAAAVFAALTELVLIRPSTAVTSSRCSSRSGWRSRSRRS